MKVKIYKYFPTFIKLFRKKMLPFWGILLVLTLLACDRRLVIREYTKDIGSNSVPIRAALITDLHNSRYGMSQHQLLNAIEGQHPDIILISGDLFDDSDSHKNTEAFLAGISHKYPCYYVTGNHEHRHGPESFAIRMSILEKYGITILDGAFETIEINGACLNLGGVSDPTAYLSQYGQPTFSFEEQLQAVSTASENGNYTVLLSHRPEYFDRYCQYGFDLVLCGHAHGGQWRIPYLLNGLYAPGQGLFPKLAGGEYHDSGTTMIVSRGLQRGKSIVPRIFNRPELVIINLI